MKIDVSNKYFCRLLLCNAYIIVMHHTMITPTSIESKHEMFMASAPN